MLTLRTPKVCALIGGRPAIVRLFESQGCFHFDPTILVVGHLAESVKDTVRPAFPDVEFVYQHEQLGTGHAAKQGARLLVARGSAGPVLVMAGDKVIEPRALQKLIGGFRTEKPALAVLVTPMVQSQVCATPRSESSGRIRASTCFRQTLCARLWKISHETTSRVRSS